MEPHPKRQKYGRGGGAEPRARGLPDPAGGDGDGEQEQEADQDGNTADPREHPTAEDAVRAQLRLLYGVVPRDWEHVATYPIADALPAMLPPLDVTQPVALGDGLFVAGDHRDTASLQGALVSGRRAARAVVRHIGLGASRPGRDDLRRNDVPEDFLDAR